MEKEIYKSKYSVFLFDEETEIFTFKYFSESEDMSDEDFKELIYAFVENLKKYKPKYVIDDDRERLYASIPEMQKWALQLAIPVLNEIKLKKFVRILPSDFISKLSGEQVEKLANTKFSAVFENRFIDDYDEAIRWINE